MELSDHSPEAHSGKIRTYSMKEQTPVGYHNYGRFAEFNGPQMPNTYHGNGYWPTSGANDSHKRKERPQTGEGRHSTKHSDKKNRQKFTNYGVFPDLSRSYLQTACQSDAHSSALFEENKKLLSKIEILEKKVRAKD
jgi:hypothetical protein